MHECMFDLCDYTYEKSSDPIAVNPCIKKKVVSKLKILVVKLVDLSQRSKTITTVRLHSIRRIVKHRMHIYCLTQCHPLQSCGSFHLSLQMLDLQRTFCHWKGLFYSQKIARRGRFHLLPKIPTHTSQRRSRESSEIFIYLIESMF